MALPLSVFKFAIIVCVFVISGTAVTIIGKWCDLLKARGTNPKEKHVFYHPYFQTGQMFLAEMMCLVVFMVWLYCYGRRLPEQNRVDDQCRNFPRNLSSLVWIIPAVMDLVANGLNYFALTIALASNFQMVRGCVILFTGFLSVVLFRMKLAISQWLGMILMFTGFILVGAKSSVDENANSYVVNSDIITMFFLLTLAQFFTAIQLVLEEKFMKKFRVHPLQAAGLEGVYGFLAMSGILVLMYFIHKAPPYLSQHFNQTHARFEDSIDAFAMMGNNVQLLMSSLLLLLVLIVYNATSIIIVKERNAITFVVMDSIRSFPIWWFSLAENWQEFDAFEIIGYSILAMGISIYFDIIFTPCIQKLRQVVLYKLLDYEPLPGGNGEAINEGRAPDDGTADDDGDDIEYNNRGHM